MEMATTFKQTAIMKLLSAYFVSLILQLAVVFQIAAQDIPFKDDADYDIKLDYTFRVRPPVSSSNVNLTETQREMERRYNSSSLPYLIIFVNVKTLQENEKSFRVSDNARRTISNKKLKGPVSLKVDMGFTSDVKDGISPHTYYISFLNDKKDPVSQIVFSIDQEGTFLVNNEVRGKF